VQYSLFAGPSTREWTLIVTATEGIGAAVGTADGTNDAFAVVFTLNCDFSSNDDVAELAPSGASKCSAVVRTTRMDGAARDV
jgi:hypothetical protein